MRYRDVLRWSLIAIAIFLMGPTWPRDDTGTPAAQCSFIGSDGTPTLCSPLSPLPTGAGVTTAETDPTGWGKNFFQSSGSLRFDVTAGVFFGDRSVLAFQASSPGDAMEAHLSQDGGRTFALIATSAAPGGIATVETALRFGGVFFVGGTSTVGGGEDGLWRSSDGVAAWTNIDLPGITETVVQALAGQGTTVLAVGQPGAVGFVCRSTTSGTTFASCVDFGAFATFNSLSVASPSANIWLIADVAGTVGRSTDDGGTFTSVLAMGGTYGTVTCLTATVCLATNGTGTIWQSTNAGATWTGVFTSGATAAFRAFINFGSGVVTAHSSTVGNLAAYRSSDFGATWTFQVALPGDVTSNFWGSAISLNGRGMLLGDAAAVDPGWFSPIVGPGETIIAGQSGNRWDIDSTGAGLVRLPSMSASGRPFTVPLQWALVATRTCSTPAANTAATVSVTGVAGQSIFLFSYIAFYTTAPAAAQTLTVADAAATVWRDIVNGANTPTRHAFGGPVQLSTAGTLAVTLPAGGAGVSGVLCVVAGGPVAQ